MSLKNRERTEGIRGNAVQDSATLHSKQYRSIQGTELWRPCAYPQVTYQDSNEWSIPRNTKKPKTSTAMTVLLFQLNNV